MKGKLITNPNIIFREEGDEALLCDPETGKVRVLNQLGSFIWKLCDGGCTRGEMIQIIMKRCKGATRKEVERDLDRFIEELRKYSLIETAKE